MAYVATLQRGPPAGCHKKRFVREYPNATIGRAECTGGSDRGGVERATVRERARGGSVVLSFSYKVPVGWVVLRRRRKVPVGSYCHAHVKFQPVVLSGRRKVPTDRLCAILSAENSATPTRAPKRHGRAREVGFCGCGLYLLAAWDFRKCFWHEKKPRLGKGK